MNVFHELSYSLLHSLISFFSCRLACERRDRLAPHSSSWQYPWPSGHPPPPPSLPLSFPLPLSPSLPPSLPPSFSLSLSLPPSLPPSLSLSLSLPPSLPPCLRLSLPPPLAPAPPYLFSSLPISGLPFYLWASSLPFSSPPSPFPKKRVEYMYFCTNVCCITQTHTWENKGGECFMKNV
jgi:hypothetical protein